MPEQRLVSWYSKIMIIRGLHEQQLQFQFVTFAVLFVLAHPEMHPILTGARSEGVGEPPNKGFFGGITALPSYFLDGATGVYYKFARRLKSKLFNSFAGCMIQLRTVLPHERPFTHPNLSRKPTVKAVLR